MVKACRFIGTLAFVGVFSQLVSNPALAQPRFQDSPEATVAGVTRHYYVRAENVSWDYSPSGIDQTHGSKIPAPWDKGNVWDKMRYIEYTDATYTNLKPQPEHLGVLGPVIRAEVGDWIFVHFCNGGDQPYSMHPHGVRYDKDSEGAHYGEPGEGAMVDPGQCFTYKWFADLESGPTPSQPSSIVWWYHSHINEPEETNAGLLGALIITRKGWAKSRINPRPFDVDREFVTAFFVFSEADGEEVGMMHSINGRFFGNLGGLEMNSGEKVRWHVLGMGNEVDLHTAHWHGKTLNYEGHRTDVIGLLPAQMATADMVADNPGTWMLHCHVSDHLNGGMQTTYKILSAKK